MTDQQPKLPDTNELLHNNGEGSPKLEYSIAFPVSLHFRRTFAYSSSMVDLLLFF